MMIERGFEMKKLEEMLSKKSNSKILDVGTGRGGFIKTINEINSNYSEIVGIDISENALKIAREGFDDKRISFLNMNATKMSFDDESFDVVCLSNSLHHLDELQYTIDEMERVLAPKGYLIFNEMYSDVEKNMQKTHVEMHHFWAEIDRLNQVTHNETMKRGEIIEILEKVSKGKMIEAWDMKVSDSEDEKLSEEDYKYLENLLMKYLERVNEHKDYSYFQQKADKLKERLRTVGFKSATQLIVVIEKVRTPNERANLSRDMGAKL